MKKDKIFYVFIFIIIFTTFLLFTNCTSGSGEKSDIKETEESTEQGIETDEMQEDEELNNTKESESEEEYFSSWEEKSDAIRELIKNDIIESYFGGVLTKFEYNSENAPITIAYNTKCSSQGEIIRELFDIIFFFSGTEMDNDFYVTATDSTGLSYNSYSSTDTVQRIRDYELSFDEWVKIAIEEEVIDENDFVQEEESKTEEVATEKESDEEAVLNQIMEHAKKDWPNDKDMQEFQYNNQVDAYHEILKLPNTSDYHEGILTDAQKDWSGDYEMQLFQYENQLDAYHEILNLPNTSDYHEGILTDAQKDWSGDYEMQLFQYENQLDAYHEILNLPNTNDYNEAALNKAKSDWPGDYEMQLWQYNNEK